MQRQKRVACIHDLACLGRCSLSVALPVLSAMGHNVCALPTMLLSAHTGGFGDVAKSDEADFCKKALAHYNKLYEEFDCVYSGYLAYASAAELVNKALLQSKKALFVLDPVLGDNAKMYTGIDKEMLTVMRMLAKKADVLLPNVTESAFLTGENPTEQLLTEKHIINRLHKLSLLCSGDIAITGVRLENKSAINAVRTKKGEIVLLEFSLQDGAYPGTGDLFASVVTGALLNGTSFAKAIASAAQFTEECVAAANAAGMPARYGVPFEPLLQNICKI